MPDAAELTDAYRAFRLRLTDLGRSLDSTTANAMTSTCPEWSSKDILAHMVGIAADILDGNVEGAATEAWADAQVDKRRSATLSEVLDEWDTKGPLLEELLENVASNMPYQFFIDAFTHDWDLREAVGAAPVSPDFSLVAHTLPQILDSLAARCAERNLPTIDLVLHGLKGIAQQSTLGTASTGVVRIEMSLFEFLRLAMGRRSRAQAEAALGVADLPDGSWLDAFVFWSLNDQDIVDPVA